MLNPLAKYLEKNKLSVGAFARASKLDRATVYRIVKGQRGAGASMMGRIEEATGGAVPVSAWFKRRAA